MGFFLSVQLRFTIDQTIFCNDCNEPPPIHVENEQNPRLFWCQLALPLAYTPAVQTQRTSLQHRSGGTHSLHVL